MTSASQPPSALSGPDKEHLASGSFGLNDRATPTPSHRKGQAKDFQPAPGAPPPFPGAAGTPQKQSSNMPRNLPVKRFDGDPLGRADVQHALLCHLFSDTRRVFTNPRPGDRSSTGSSSGSTASGNAGITAPVWPYGMSAGCLRRSDETEEEYQTWKETKERYEKWRKRMDRKERLAKKAAEAEAKAAAAAESGKDSEPAAEAADDDANGNDEKDELAEGPTEGEPEKNPEVEEEDDLDDDEPLDEDEFVKPGAAKLTFKELYIEALLNSGKCTKSMRDKILADEEYAEDFAKVCLLVNVGRINTTLAFYPEMKTVLRSYHPLPSVQNNENTRRNMQDAPRMKSLLKGVLIDTERPGPPTAGPSAGQAPKVQKPNALSEEAPSDFKEVIKRYNAGTVPPTSVVTLIFLLSMHANEVTENHFPSPHDSHSLFYPHSEYPLPSKQRANAFLWLLYHYLEGPASKPPGEQPNPFDDDTSLTSIKLAQEAYNSLSEEERRKRHNQPWRGLVNPEWQKWKAIDEKLKADADEAAIKSGTKDAGSAPAGKAGSEAGSTRKDVGDDSAEIKKEGAADDADVSMEDVEKSATSTADAAIDKPVSDEAALEEKEKEELELGPEPPSHTHRILVPSLDVISYDQAAKENTDTEEEIRWGKQMQSERAAFLAKFQEEEAAKAAVGGSPAPSTGTASGKGRKGGAGASSATPGAGGGGSVKREDTDRGTPSDAELSFTGPPTGSKNKKRPNANTNASGQAGDLSKRSRMASPITIEDSSEPNVVGSNEFSPNGGPRGSAAEDILSQDPYLNPNIDIKSRIRPSLWDLDLSMPSNLSSGQVESLPQIAWSRILERAQRGVGDACYESDEEEFAEEEAQQEVQQARTRSEIVRILKSLRDVVRPDVFEEENREFRAKVFGNRGGHPVDYEDDDIEIAENDDDEDDLPLAGDKHQSRRNGVPTRR